ncbi:MAG: hypothetical protein AB1427_20010 [Thermodesulfobacteriota bacterium]
MSGSDFKARHVTKEYCQTIYSSPDKVFPLLCPVREAEWLDGWRYTMIYSKSGLVEDGAVFSTPHEGEPDTVWVVTNHDPSNLRVQFARFTHQSRVCVLDIGVRVRDEGSSYVDIAYTYTGISSAGNQFIDDLTDDAFYADVKHWEDSVNHFLRTGEQLKRA